MRRLAIPVLSLSLLVGGVAQTFRLPIAAFSYGITDLDGARRHGYRVPPQPDAPKAELTEDQIKVLYGKRPYRGGKLRRLPEGPEGSGSLPEVVLMHEAERLRLRLLETWFEAESAIQKAMMKKDAAALRKLDELHGKKVNAARKILAEA